MSPDGHTADCPLCEKSRRFHRTKTRASYTCDSCRVHIQPMKDTIFDKSATSLIPRGVVDAQPCKRRAIREV